MTSIARSSLAACLLALTLPFLALSAPAAADVHIEVLTPAEAEARAVAPKAIASAPPKIADGPAVVLPYYEVDMTKVDGDTTLFAVRNNSNEAQAVRYSIYDAESGANPLVFEEVILDGHAVRPVNMRFVPGMLGGVDGRATGFMVVETPQTDSLDVLMGDFFRVDASGTEANGGRLVDVDETNCRTWSHRFFSGGAFDGGTEMAFLALDAPSDGPTVLGSVYNEAGTLSAVVAIQTDQQSFEFSDIELDLPVDAGTIDWAFQGDGHGMVLATYTATGLLSVGAKATCIDALGSTGGGGGGDGGGNGGGDGGGGDGGGNGGGDGGGNGGGNGGGGGGGGDVDPNAVVFELPGRFLTCNNCGNWQYDMPFGGGRQFRKIVVDFDFFVSRFDPNKPRGFHCIFWLNNGTRWQDMLAYVNSRGTQNRTTFQSNGPLGNPIGVESYASPGVQEGQTYSMHWEYDTIQKVTWYQIRNSSGQVVVSDTIQLPSFTQPVGTSYAFVQFGSQPGGAAESLTNGWWWANYRAQFIP